ncbi:MAG: polyribonucleotide nucleotidyltransferase [Chloroflexota bacterium]|nr:polyribonucleotide nucleotidyltransferase [Chloroflexota bacterium]
MPHRYECLLGSQPLVIETGAIANQADGAVTVRYGDTLILATVCVSKGQREGISMVPLTVDYEEKHYAAGKIPGSFIRRESRPSQEAILADRIIDRSMRPLINKSLRNETQIVITVLSTDQENDPDILAMIGASAALSMSSVPFDGPISAVRVGYIDGKLALNPTFTELTESSLDIVISSSSGAPVMVEAEADEVADEIILEAIKLGQEANQAIIRLQEQLREELGKPKLEPILIEAGAEVMEAVASIVGDRLGGVVHKTKIERQADLDAIEQELQQALEERFAAAEIAAALEEMVKKAVRSQILEKGTRTAGRGMAEVRPISCDVGVLPRTHGSGLFSRGATQVLSTTTLGSSSKEQMIDTISQQEKKRFLHHYNFPPFCVGETGRMTGPKRREIGHGALAERALSPVIPSADEFPYTLRVVSEVLSSNGSSSMGSVCASSLSLMDAGVPIKKPVAGVAMGLIAEGDKYVILTDIEGLEDAYGNMDFKVAGTADGINALQMDIKLKGIPYEVIEKGLRQAYEARMFILDKMNQTISQNRPELSKYAPRIFKLTVNPDKIGTIIGPGGKMIRWITEQTKCTVDIEDDGTVLIASNDEENANKAIKIIEDLTKEVEVGTVYTGRVTRLMDFGAFVEVLPGKEGLVHISELADYRVARVEDAVKVGDEVMVKVIEIDRMGRVNLSRRAVFQESEGGDGAKAAQPSGNRPKPQQSGFPRGDRPRRDQSRPHRPNSNR